jgi:hypothetical protein
MKTWLFNPFKFVAGVKALIIGITAMLFTATLAWYGKFHLDGILDAHTNYNKTAYYLSLVETIIDWFSVVLPLYIFSRIFSDSSVRFIDFAGTQAMARYPIFFVVLIAMFITPDLKNVKPDELTKGFMNNPALMVQQSIAGLAILILGIWTIVLMYNAYSVSANLKGPKAAWSFISSIIIAEVLSKIIIHALSDYYF